MYFFTNQIVIKKWRPEKLTEYFTSHLSKNETIFSFVVPVNMSNKTITLYLWVVFGYITSTIYTSVKCTVMSLLFVSQ